jgi:putative inorganic carbon (HCO3(-)) transporter
MASSLADRVQRGWAIGRVEVGRLSLVDLGPFLMAAVVFKLAISDGGRDPLSLTMAQISSYAALAVLVWTRRAHVGSVGRAMLVMLGVILFTALTSVRPEASAREVLLWAMYLGVAVVTASSLHGHAAARRMLDFLVAIAGWVVLIALFLFWGGNNPGMRWYATFYWPNPFAAFLLLVLPLEVVRLISARNSREAAAHTILTVLLTTAVVLTYSRGAWLSLLLIAPVALALLRPPSWTAAAGRLLIVALLVSGAVMSLTRTPASPSGGQGVAARAASIADTGDLSIQGRVSFWRAAFDIFRDHPLTGTGPGTFGAVHARYQRDVRFYARDAHNLYVQTLAEMGIPGALALGFLVLTIISVWLRALRQSAFGEPYTLVLGAGLGVLAFFIHSAMDMDWAFYANPAMAFALIGVIASFDRAPAGQSPHQQAALFGPRVLALVALATAMLATLTMHWAHIAYQAGYSHARSGRYGAALQHYVTASVRNPLQPRYPAAAGYAASRSGDRDQLAVFYIRHAISLDRMNASHPIQLADLLLSRAGGDAQRLAEAEHWLMVALEVDPLNRPETYRLLAKTMIRQKRLRDADQVYRRALRLYLGQNLEGEMNRLILWPQVVGLAIDAAELAVQMGDHTYATEILRRVLWEDPENPDVKAALVLLK